MKTFQTLSTAALGVLLACPASAAWKRLSEQDFRVHPKNLARHHIEASLTTASNLAGDLNLGLNNEDRNLSSQALLSEDPTVGTPLAQGTSEVIVSLDQIEILNTLNFVNEQGVGKVTVHTALTDTAASGNQWHENGFVVFDADRRVVSLQLGGIDAKYVKVVFEMAEPGRVYSFGIFGESDIDEYLLEEIDPQARQQVSAVPHASNQAHVDLNLLAAYTKARVAYVSSGSGDPTALIDADSSTAYRFDSTDLYPTVIIDLAGAAPIDRVSALYSKHNTRMAVFAMAELPETLDWIGRTSFDSETLDAYKPQNMGSDVEGEGRLALSLSGNETRYLVYQFARGEDTENFEIHELAAFSQSLSEELALLRDEWNAKSYAYGGGKSPVGGKDSQYDEHTSHRMDAYAGPLAGYSGASFLRRGSGGLSRGGGFGRRGGSDQDAVRIIEREVVREVTAIHNLVQFVQAPAIGGGTDPAAAEATTEAAAAARVQIVSRIAVSATTVEGVGHLYFNVGSGEAPPGFIFASPAFEGTHEGGVIAAETIEEALTPGEVFRFDPAPPVPAPVADAANAANVAGGATDGAAGIAPAPEGTPTAPESNPPAVPDTPGEPPVGPPPGEAPTGVPPTEAPVGPPPTDPPVGAV